jgi:transcriptional regulator with XRE-family HTH domain
MDTDQLIRKRKRLKLTQEGLADLLGVRQNTVARWERGEREYPAFLELAMKWIEQEQRRLRK